MAAKRTTKKAVKASRKKSTRRTSTRRTSKAKPNRKGSRADEALKLRRRGLSYAQVAQRMGYGGSYPSSAAYTMCRLGVRREVGDDPKAIKAAMDELAAAARAARQK